MHFTNLVIAGLAATGAQAAALKSSSKTTKHAAPTPVKGPATVSNREAAISSVIALMNSKKPTLKSHEVTKTITGEAPKTTQLSVHTATSTKKGVHAREAAPLTINVPGAIATIASALGAGSSALNAIASSASAAIASAAADVPKAACQAELSSAFKFVPSVDSMFGFLNESTFPTIAANVSVPTNYTWLYTGYYSSLNQNGYLYYTEHAAYTPSDCSAICDATSNCWGFDIYYERDPVITPALSCPNPTSQTKIRCAYYSQALDLTAAINVGQWRANFGVVISGGNGYQKVTPPKIVTTSSIAVTTPSVAATTPAVAVTTSAATTTSAAAAATPTFTASNFNILAAYYADTNITAYARSNWLLSTGFSINTNIPTTSVADPWVGNNNKTITILYSYKSETRVFAALQGSGSYAQLDSSFSTAGAPGCSLTTSYTAPSTASANIISVVYGTSQIGSTIFSTLYSLLSLFGSFTVGTTFFGFDPNPGVTKSCVIFYTKSGVLNAMTGRNGATVTFSNSLFGF